MGALCDRQNYDTLIHKHTILSISFEWLIIAIITLLAHFAIKRIKIIPLVWILFSFFLSYELLH